MKLELVTYVCGDCGHRFQAPALNPYAYGEFLLRSPTNALAHLNALAHETYNEVDALLAQLPETARFTPAQRADVLRAVFGPAACDPDDRGDAFVVNAWPRCPNCGSRRGTWFEHPEPAPTVDVVVAEVTHRRWSVMGRDEKVAAVRGEVRKLTQPA